MYYDRKIVAEIKTVFKACFDLVIEPKFMLWKTEILRF